MMRSSRRKWLGSDSSRFFFLTVRVVVKVCTIASACASASARAAWNSSLLSNGSSDWSGAGRIRFSLRWPLTKWLSSLRSFSNSRPSSSIVLPCCAMVAACSRDGSRWRLNDGWIAVAIVRNVVRLDHAAYDNELCKNRQRERAEIGKNSTNSFRRTFRDGWQARCSRATRLRRRGVECVSSAPLHARQFDPRQQQRQVGRVHQDMIGVRRTVRSLESPAFQTLVQTIISPSRSQCISLIRSSRRLRNRNRSPERTSRWNSD